MTLTNLQKQNWRYQLGVKRLFLNCMVNDLFDVNKYFSLHSIKYMFDNDLDVVQARSLNKFPNTYKNISIYREKRNEILIRMDIDNKQSLHINFDVRIPSSEIS